jgi:hypothetical protein
MATVKLIEYEEANQTNALVEGFQVELDDVFKDGGRQS